MDSLDILDQGEWFGYSCEARSAWIFCTRLLFVSGAVYGFVLMSRFKLWGKLKFKGAGAPQMINERFLPYATWAVALSIVGYSMYEATAFNREVLYLKGPSLLETGCRGLQPYEEEFDLAGATVAFQNHHQKGPDRSDMIISSPGHRRITIDLNSRFYPNLVRFAPQVMAAYVQRLKNDGEPVPAALRTLN